MDVNKLDIIVYLKQPFYLDKKIDALLALKSQNKAIACRCAENCGNGIDRISIEESIRRICDLDLQINMEINRLADVRNDVFNQINAINNPDLESVLINRFLNCMSIEKTAEKMNYSIAAVKLKQNQAVEKMKAKNISHN